MTVDTTRAASIVTLEVLETQISFNDRRYEERFRASEEAVKSALASQKEATAAAFAASEKAIVKAEDAQREYNIRSNEFRGQLDDQSKLLLARSEANVQFAGITKRTDELAAQIAGLRESRSVGSGRDEALLAARTTARWMLGVVVSIVGLSITVVLYLLRR